METVNFKLSLSKPEFDALKKLANDKGLGIERTLEDIVAESLVVKGLIKESAERDGRKFVRLDE